MAAIAHTAAEIAKHLGAQIVGNPQVVLTGFAPADAAKPGDLTFAENEHYFEKALLSQASAVLVPELRPECAKTLIVVANARVAFARVLPLFVPEPTFAPGVHPSAVVHESAQVDPAAHIGPHCVIGEGCSIGARTVLEAGVSVGADCLLGSDCHLFPNVTLYPRTRAGNRVRLHAGTVVGSDGFGYVLDGGAHRKVPQIGWVEIGDDVETGANVAIDRGALGPTVIGKGTKIDNLVQIGHNVIVGEHCVLVAQVGIAGSTKLGNYVTLAGQAGIAGHLNIGERATVAAKGGVMNDIPAGEKWLGIPARPSQQMKRQFIAVERLPDLLKRVAALERQLESTRSTQPQPPADTCSVS